MMTSQLLLLLILTIACASGLTYLLYQNLFKDKTQRILAIFRFLSFFLLGLLLINFTLNTTSYTLEKPKLIFAFDDSESIKKLTNTSEINKFIAHLKTDEALNSDYDIDFLSFGSTTKTLLDSLSFEEKSTDISKTIDYINTIDEPETSLVLVTDGNQTLGEDYNFKSFNDNINATILVAGDTTSYTDTKIDLVNVNSYAYYKNKFPVEVFVSQNTKKPTEQKLNLREGEKLISSKRVEIPSEGSFRTEFLIPAEPVGMKVLKLELEPISGEKNVVNNQKTVSIDVIDSRSKVLLISDIIHPDIGFFNRILDSNKELEFTTKTTEDSFQISDYDLVLFYQPQSTFKTVIQKVQEKNINHFIIGGSHTDYKFLNGLNLGFQKEIVASTEEYSSSLTTDFGLFNVDNLNFKNYPPLKDEFGDISLTKDYSVLLQKKVNGIDVKSPQWIFSNQDNVKQSVLFGENIWRWRARHFVDNSSFVDFDKTFQKILQFLSQTKSKNTLAVDVESVINSGENQLLKVNYYNANFENDTRYDFDIHLKNSDSDKAQNSRLIKQEDGYIFDLSKLKPGNYTYSISSDEVDIKKGGKFQVLDYSSEMQFENANFKGLQNIAGTNATLLLSERERLISKLKENKSKAIQKSIKKKQSLIDFEWLILLLALTLGLEWFYRKYKGLI